MRPYAHLTAEELASSEREWRAKERTGTVDVKRAARYALRELQEEWLLRGASEIADDVD